MKLTTLLRRAISGSTKRPPSDWSSSPKPPPPPRAAGARNAAEAAAGDVSSHERSADSDPVSSTIRNSNMNRARLRLAQGEQGPWYVELFDDSYLLSTPRTSPRVLARECDHLEHGLGLVKGAHILDVACGDGSHAMELGRRGYQVTGIDLSEALIGYASRRVRRNDLGGVAFQNMDMRKVSFRASFDAVMCVGSSFGFFDDSTNMKVLERMAGSLKPGGRLVLDTMNREYACSDLRRQNLWRHEEALVSEHVHMDYTSNRLHNSRQLVMDDGFQRLDKISIRLYSLHELKKMLEDVGMCIEGVSGGPESGPNYLGSLSRRMMVVACLDGGDR